MDGRRPHSAWLVEETGEGALLVYADRPAGDAWVWRELPADDPVARLLVSLAELAWAEGLGEPLPEQRGQGQTEERGADGPPRPSPP
jgi:hypothetical protein